MIKIDFHGSTHGHFLEYVSNVYIMQTAPSQCSIFKPPTYSAHAPDQNYLDNRIIECGHYSNKLYNLTIDQDDIVIRIDIDPSDDRLFFVALSNLMYKAGDVGFERQQLSIPEHVRNNPAILRNNWYSKINERDTFVSHYNDFTEIYNPTFYFSFGSFFSFVDFCTELSRLSKFLNQTFYPTKSLYDLWSCFIQVNQGWQSYVKCKDLLNKIFAGENVDFVCTSLEEAWINYNLSNVCRMFDGTLFDQPHYPNNTQLIYNLVQQHLVNS